MDMICLGISPIIAPSILVIAGVMVKNETLKRLVRELINFDRVSIQFIVESKNRKNKKWILTQNTQNEKKYIFERKIEDRSERFIVNSDNLKDQENLSSEDKKLLFNLLKRLKDNQIDRISVGGLKSKNPILTASIGQSIISNITKHISLKDKRKLYILWKDGNKEEFRKELHDIILNIITAQLEDKLKSGDLPTPIFPTSVAQSEIPNYYIYEPKETYTSDTKIKLFNKLISSVSGRCGGRLYGLYIPEEGTEMNEILRDYVPDFFNININRIADLNFKLDAHKIKPFEYAFYLLNKVLQEMFRRNKVPDYHVELIIIEGVGGRKKFFSHYIIPNLSDIFYKLYHGDDKYHTYTSGKITSKIKALVSSFLVEGWNIDKKLMENNSEIAHAYINRLLYHILYHRRLDIDSILFLEDLKIKLRVTTPISFLDEVVSWM